MASTTSPTGNHHGQTPERAEQAPAQQDAGVEAGSASPKSKSVSPASDDGEPSSKEGSREPGETSASPAAPSAEAAQWQAIWSPQYNAYYFFNAATQETTWVNPLQPQASSSSATEGAAAESSAPSEADEGEGNAEAGPSTGPQLSRVAAEHAAMQAAALAQGIDPLLAHLDPTLMQSSIPGASGPSDLPTFKAQFNARTGQFAPMSARTPGHLSEFERAKRMSEFYFDVGKWEEDLAKRGGRLMGEEGEEDETGKKRKRPSKKDIERFKEQKRLKKIAKTAWLRT